MALRPRSAKKPSDAEVAALADKLTDKQYGGISPDTKTEKQVQRSLALPKSLDQAITRASAENKLSGTGPQNTSAVIREALEQYLERRKKNNLIE
jgi:Predicted transcriptional regulators containing the CopG/Arc/MetJ DNA-binding domain and a metal-binding domain